MEGADTRLLKFGMQVVINHVRMFRCRVEVYPCQGQLGFDPEVIKSTLEAMGEPHEKEMHELTMGVGDQ